MISAITEKSASPKLYLWATVAFISGISLMRGFFFPETDVLWNIRAGQETLVDGIATHDTWNWLLQGEEWLTNSWLWNVLLSLAYEPWGIVGVSLFTTIVTAITLAILFLFIRHVTQLSSAGNFFLLIAISMTLLPWLNGRAQQADYLIAAGFLLLAHVLAKKSRILLILSAFILAILWMNLHLTAPLAVVLFPASYWFITTDGMKKKIATTSSIFAVTFVGLLCTPFGINGITKTLLVVNESRNVMVEWMAVPYSEELLPIMILSLAIFGVGMLFISIKAKQWLFSLAILCLLLMSYNAIRFTPFLIIFSLVGAGLIPQLHLASQKLVTYFCSAISALILLVALVFAGYQISNPSQITLLNPASFEAIPSNARLLTLQNGGGMVLLYRQDVSPSLDGRNDIIGQERIKLIYSLFYTKDAVFVSEWLTTNQVGSVFIQSDDTYKLTATMKELGWQEKKVPDGSLYLPSSN